MSPAFGDWGWVKWGGYILVAEFVTDAWPGITIVIENMLIFGHCKNCLDPSPPVFWTPTKTKYKLIFLCLLLARRNWPVPSFLDFTAIIKLFMTLTIHCLGLQYKINVENIVSIIWEKAIRECVTTLVIKVKVLINTSAHDQIMGKSKH